MSLSKNTKTKNGLILAIQYYKTKILSGEKMKVEIERYILILKYDGEDRYLTPTDGFSDDICEALKLKSNIIAADVKDECFKEYDVDLQIIPLKVTYEW